MNGNRFKLISKLLRYDYYDMKLKVKMWMVYIVEEMNIVNDKSRLASLVGVDLQKCVILKFRHCSLSVLDICKSELV